MFGYIVPDASSLSKEQMERYRSHYCGLCHSLSRRYGNIERFSLSYDLTFLSILLQSMYEEPQTETESLCPPHPFKRHKTLSGPVIDYCADMNLLLTYHKLMDDVQDEGTLIARVGEKAFRKTYRQIEERYPKTCEKVRSYLREIGLLEKKDQANPDDLMNWSGEMLGAVYAYHPKDYWNDTIVEVGKAIGRFVYLMDAYEDLPEDLKQKRFNPLKALSKEPDYDDFIKKSLELLMGEASEVLEILPLEEDLDLLRNVLYSGCWTRYGVLYRKRHPEEEANKPKEKSHA